MNVDHKSVRWTFLLKWVLASATGFFIGAEGAEFAGALLSRTPLTMNYTYAVGMTAYGGVFGISLGITQWLVLRHLLRQPVWWVLSTTLGWAVAGYWQGYNNLEGPGFIFVAGVPTGLLQWLVLRRLAYRSAWWMIANAIGWAISLNLSIQVASILSRVIPTSGLVYLLYLLSIGAIAGGVTGFVLIQIVRRPKVTNHP